MFRRFITSKTRSPVKASFDKLARVELDSLNGWHSCKRPPGLNAHSSVKRINPNERSKKKYNSLGHFLADEVFPPPIEMSFRGRAGVPLLMRLSVSSRWTCPYRIDPKSGSRLGF